MRYQNRINTDIMRVMWIEGQDDGQIARAFGVSKQAVFLRRQEIGLVAQSKRRPETAAVESPPCAPVAPVEITIADELRSADWETLAVIALREGWSLVKAQTEFHRARR